MDAPSVKAATRRAHPRPTAEGTAAVVAQQLFIEKAGLPSPLLNAIKRLAAFQNPEFSQKQNLRFWTAMTPRVIACAEDFSQHVALPRGCRTDLEQFLKEHGASLVVDCFCRCAGAAT